MSVPMRLIPVLKEVVWGGGWLASALGREARPDAKLGESWEAYSGSVIADGPYAGKTLGDLYATSREEIFGAATARFERFPLLVKFIDAHQNLSIQVHPDDALAFRLEGYPYGKTEFWYVLEAEPGARIIYGLSGSGLTKAELQTALQSQTILDYCSHVPVTAGDVVEIPAGTVHALTEGVVVYELQQDCDITYRLYDWGRTDREIHLEKGLEAIDPARHSLQVSHPIVEVVEGLGSAALASSPYYRATLYEIGAKTSLPTSDATFALVTVLAGEGAIGSEDGGSLEVKTGDTLFLPAGASVTVSPGGGAVRLVYSTLPV